MACRGVLAAGWNFLLEPQLTVNNWIVVTSNEIYICMDAFIRRVSSAANLSTLARFVLISWAGIRCPGYISVTIFKVVNCIAIQGFE